MRNGSGGDGLDGGGLEPLPEGFDPHAVDINEASEDLLWKVLPLMEGHRKAETLYVLGSRLARNDRWDQAVVCAEESAQEWEKLDNSGGLVTGLLAAATCRSHLAHYDAAIEHYIRVIALLRTYGPEAHLLEAHTNLGNVLVEIDRHEDATAEFLAALDLAQNQDDDAALGYLYERIAGSRRASGQPYEQVREDLVAARSHYAAAKDLERVIEINDQMARLCDSNDDYETAAVYLEENLHLAKSLGTAQARGVAHYRYAGALRLCGRWSEAFEHIDQARELLQGIGDYERMVWCDLERLWCLQRAGRTTEAVQLLQTLWVTVRIVGGVHEINSVVFDLYLDALGRSDDDDRARICRQAITWATDNDDLELRQRFEVELALLHADTSDWNSMGTLVDAFDEDESARNGDPNTDALRQSAIAEIALHRGDAASAAMALAGVPMDDHLASHVLARVLRTRGLINQALVRGSGIADLARAAQLWTDLGWRQHVSATLNVLTSAHHPASD